MIGDANLYLKMENNVNENELIGEVGLMVADEKFRGRGLGKEIALCLLRYGVESIGVKKFNAVISIDNSKSMQMFNKLGFIKCSESEVFQEVTLERLVDDEFISYLKTNTKAYEILATEPNS